MHPNTKALAKYEQTTSLVSKSCVLVSMIVICLPLVVAAYNKLVGSRGI